MDLPKTFLVSYSLNLPLEFHYAEYSPIEHAYIGRVFKAGGDHHRPYVSGLSVTMSKATLRLFHKSASIDQEHSKCSAKEFGLWYGPLEDYALSECLMSLGVYPAHTRDEQGRERFMHFDPLFHSSGKSGPEWYRKHSFRNDGVATNNNNKTAPASSSCCSPEACAFHYVKAEHQNDTLVYGEDEFWHWEKQ